jgi:predicted AAA+ superfamily ATPase
MGIVDKHLKNLFYLEENIDDFAKKIVIDNAAEILKVLQDKQLAIGEYSTGRPLKWADGDGYYSVTTELIAQKEALLGRSPKKSKKAGDPYNFQWSGSTFASMVLEVGNVEEYSIFSKDGKEALLKQIYGDDLFKLSKSNNKWVNENIIEPKLSKFIEENWWLAIT